MQDEGGIVAREGHILKGAVSGIKAGDVVESADWFDS